MSEDYIIIHKPGTNKEAEVLTADKRRKSRKKSVPNPIQIQDAKIDAMFTLFKFFEGQIEESKNKIQEDSLDSLFESTLEYFDNYYIRRIIDQDERQHEHAGEDIEPINSIFNIIPTVALFTGINIHDYSDLSVNLCERLSDKFTKFLFYINEKNCTSVKNLMYSLFTQLEEIKEAVGKAKKRNLITFRQFFDNILETEQEDDEPHCVIFVIKQFEIIPKSTLENFISVISCYVEKLSIFFIIEMASQSNILYEQLSGHTISKLCIKKLYSIPPNQYIDKFITKVFIENLSPFKLSGEILRFLFDAYKNYNYSISHLIHSLTYCLSDHIQIDKLNALFVFEPTYNTNVYEKLIEDFKSESILSDQMQKSLFKSLPKTQNLTESFELVRKDWFRHHNQFSFVCKLLYEVIKRFPSENNDKCFTNTSFSNFYIQVCYLGNSSSSNRKFTESEQFANVKRLLHLASTETLHEIVNTFIQLIYGIRDKASFKSDFLNDLNALLELLKLIQNPCGDEDAQEDEADVSPVKTSRRVSTRRSVAPRAVLVDASNSPQKESPSKSLRKRKTLSTISTANSLTSIRNKFVEWICSQCAIYFDKDYSTAHPYSKYFCYSDIDNLKQRLFESPRIGIHEALLNPYKYVPDSNPSKDQLPLSVIYKLYLECGHMINLYDWLQAFVEKMEGADLNELSEGKRKLMQALFFRSITELQFLGYIKQTSRKQDHVVKLTNIACVPDA